MMGMFPIANHLVVILFSSGAPHSFINRTFVLKYEISIGAAKENFFIQSPGGHLCTKEMVYQVPVNLGGHIFPTTMIILKDQDIDVILGMNWMYQHKAIINALNRTIRVSLPASASQLLIQLPILRRSVGKVCATAVKEI